jgi:hypothetical protein
MKMLKFKKKIETSKKIYCITKPLDSWMVWSDSEFFFSNFISDGLSR